MAAYSRTVVVGNLGNDPEVKYTQGGQAVCELSIAVNETWTDKDGQRQERTEWFRAKVWGKTAENCGEYLKKGREVLVEGRMQSRKYTDKEGIERTVWELNADKVVFLGGGRDDHGHGGGNQGGGGGGNRGQGGNQGGNRGGGWHGDGGRGNQGGGGGGNRGQGGNQGGNRGGGWHGDGGRGNQGGGGGGGGGGGDYNPFDDDPIPF